MNEQCLISIIVPVYNVEKYLPKCLETIAMQTYENIEIILVDDGSTDGSDIICDEFAKTDKRVIVIHQDNKGPGHARNTGQKIARGEFLMFIDADDYIHKELVSVLYQSICKNDQYDIAIADFKQTSSLNEDIDLEGDNFSTELSEEELIPMLLTYAPYNITPNVWNKLYRRDVVENIEWHDYRGPEDLDFNLRSFMKIRKVVWVHRILYFYVQRDTSIMHTTTYKPYGDLVKILYQNLMELLPEKKKYRHLLLKKLYRQIALLRCWEMENSTCNIFQTSFKKYLKDTRKEYLGNRQISISEKILITLLIYNPRLTRWLKKLTNN